MQEAEKNIKEELGIFFFEKNDDFFVGSVVYGGSSEIILKIVLFDIKYASKQFLKNTTPICGFLESGKSCTLLHPLKKKSKINMNVGGVAAYVTEIEFEIIIIGEVYENLKEIKNIRFRPYNFEYFFEHYDPDIRAEKHKEGTLSLKIDEYVIRIEKSTKMSTVFDATKRIKLLREGKICSIEKHGGCDNEIMDSDLCFFVKDSQTEIYIDFLKKQMYSKP